MREQKSSLEFSCGLSRDPSCWLLAFSARIRRAIRPQQTAGDPASPDRPRQADLGTASDLDASARAVRSVLQRTPHRDTLDLAARVQDSQFGAPPPRTRRDPRSSVWPSACCPSAEGNDVRSRQGALRLARPWSWATPSGTASKNKQNRTRAASFSSMHSLPENDGPGQPPAFFVRFLHANSRSDRSRPLARGTSWPPRRRATRRAPHARWLRRWAARAGRR